MVMFLLICMLPLALNLQSVEAETQTWTVDDDGPADFHTIQDAIDAPEVMDGDTIFVRDGIYQENVRVDEKSLLLIGENKASTIIDGNGTEPTDLVRLANVNTAVISGFTIRNAAGYGSGICLLGCRNIKIEDTIIEDCYRGIVIAHGSDLKAVGNLIKSNTPGEGDMGMHIYDVLRMEILDNIVVGFAHGIGTSGLEFTLRNNTLADNVYLGVYLASDRNVVTQNVIINSQEGIRIHWHDITPGNEVYHNDFINNMVQASCNESTNVWDDGYPSGGNYWSDYEERYPDARELDGSGIWDTPYVIDDHNQDNYPLVEPLSPRIPSAILADLVKRQAWPEHHHYDISKDEDESQTLNARVENLGNRTAWVKVVFNTTKDNGTTSIIETDVVNIDPGETADLSADFGPLTDLDRGKYTVSARCLFSQDLIVWGQGRREKTFKFNVVA